MSERGSAARHTFYYLLVLVTLGFTATGIGQILFQVINYLLPETTYTYEAAFDEWTLRFGITAVVVTAPLLFYCTRAINKELANKTLDAHSLVRKWLTYLILLLASVTIIIDLMVTFYSFLSGEITSKFILKALVIGGIAAFVFLYYIYDITREKIEKNNKRMMLYRNLFLVVTIASLVVGLYFNTSPSAVRAEREDSERVSRLSSIHYQLQSYHSDNGTVPGSLEEIEGRLVEGRLMDPVTGTPFEYRMVSNNTYELCAEFAFSNREEEQGYRGWQDPNWLHDAGRHCFENSFKTDDDSTVAPSTEDPSELEIRREEIPLPPRA